tara:strand:- start:445 stop:723 length:279 start_codon:yes stop_codon:yes gene_type:complete
MAGSDVKAVTLTSTGAIFAGPSRIVGIYLKTNSSGSPAFIVKDGATGDTVLSIASTTSQTDSITIPDEGIKCNTNPQLTTLTAIDSITFFLS